MTILFESFGWVLLRKLCSCQSRGKKSIRFNTVVWVWCIILCRIKISKQTIENKRFIYANIPILHEDNVIYSVLLFTGCLTKQLTHIILCHFTFWVKIVKKGCRRNSRKIKFQELSIKTTYFQMSWNISSNWITSQQPDKAYNTKKWEKKTARTPENIAPERNSVGWHRSPCSYVPPEQRLPHGAYFINCFRTVWMRY